MFGTHRADRPKGKDPRRIRDRLAVIDNLGREEGRLRVVLQPLKGLDAARGRKAFDVKC